MPLGRILALALLAILVAATALIGQFAFRADQTVLRHRFAHEAIDGWLAPLEDSANHEAFVSAAWADLRSALGWSIPLAIRDVVEDAALDAFRPDWIISVVKRMHTISYLYMRGTEDEISLTVPFGEFKRSVSSLARERLVAQVANQVSGQINQLPSSIDLWEAIPEEEAVSIERWIRRVPAVSILLQYLVPGIFLGLTLVFGRPGSAMVASGAGLALSGAGMLVIVVTLADGIAGRLARSLQVILPGRPTWFYGPAGDTFADAIRSGVGFAWFLVALGLVIAALGVLVVRRWNDTYSFVSSARSTIRDSIRDA